jgi:hypothetical protein
MEQDHIVPLHLGGEHDISNLQWLCYDCHKKKSGAEASAYLTNAIVSPETREKMRQGRLGKKMSAETKKRISESLTQAYQEGRRKGGKA